MSNAKYIIGIDLGTTNCTLAYVSLDDETNEIHQFPIPQVCDVGQTKEEHSLPSFLYFALEEEINSKSLALPWSETQKFSLGLYARERASEVPGRVISSAKSWLCHDGIDRRAPILPTQSEEDSKNKMSPVEVISNLLQHLKDAWDETFSHSPFLEQEILITVPASFDPSARQLVQEAAQNVDFPDTLVLLEEPQAAFYAWLKQEEDTWRKQLNVGDHVLVVDIGGGTSDFTLISVQEEEGDLTLERMAVGSHLLLGGDNMDLALAYHAKASFEEEGHTIDDWQFSQLIAKSRKIKECLLGENAPDQVDVTLQGRGSGLIAGSLKTTLEKEKIQNILVDGFIPKVSPSEQSSIEKRGGIQEIGLPFAQDPRISAQLAKFLSMTGEGGEGGTENFIVPNAVLFNGGTMKASALKERITTLLQDWGKELGQGSCTLLEEGDLDNAVSRGAVVYGLARHGKAIRIRGGTSRSYFIGVEGSAPAVPGIPPPLSALCVVPFGMEEGSSTSLEQQEFSLLLGEPTTFRFFSHSTPKLSSGEEVQVGSQVKKWALELSELHPIETVLDKQEDEGKTVTVKLESKVTELGVLELWCVSEEGKRWKLEFDIRGSETASV